jgi:hypothetical protein
MTPIRDRKCIYHLTALDNLNSIIDNGLLSRKSLEQCDICFADVADTEIIEKRQTLKIVDCVPFHFHTYTNFDVCVQQRFDKVFIYLAIYKNKARDKNFLIIPKHPLSCESNEVFDYDEGLEQIDWDIMNLTSQQNGYDSSVRMAECLSNHCDLSISDINIIFVPNAEVEQAVHAILASRNIVSINVIKNENLFVR